MSIPRSRRRHSYTGLEDDNFRSVQNFNLSRKNSTCCSSILCNAKRKKCGCFCCTNKCITTCLLTALILLFFTPYFLYNYLLTTERTHGQQQQREGQQNYFDTPGVISNDYISFSQPSLALPNIKLLKDDNLDEENFFLRYEPKEIISDTYHRRLEELNRIKSSLLSEIRRLEQKRNDLRLEIDNFHIQAEHLQTALRGGVKEMEQLRISLQQTKTIQKEMAEKNTPEIVLPAPLFPLKFPDQDLGINSILKNSNFSYTLASCFDYSRCSITSNFPVYIYGLGNTGVDAGICDLDSMEILRITLPNIVRDPDKACVFVAVLNEHTIFDQNTIRKLKFWSITGNGSNHVILGGKVGDFNLRQRAIFISDNKPTLRINFDLFSPKISKIIDQEILHFSITPARRKFLFSIFRCPDFNDFPQDKGQYLKSALQRISRTKTDDLIYFGDRKCDDFLSNIINNNSIGKTDKVLRNSTFNLIFTGSNFAGSNNFIYEFIDSLRNGAIPVVLFEDSDGIFDYLNLLPFGETLDWRLAALILPLSRLSETHFYLRGFNDEDMLTLRRNGAMFFQRYLATKQAVFETIFAILRQRLTIPASSINSKTSANLFENSDGKTFTNSNFSLDTQQNFDADEYLGPVEQPLASPAYQQNFSMLSLHSYAIWNVYADPFRLHPQNPFTKFPMPAEAKFTGSQFGFRPINDGAGGSGNEFRQALGGNFPREQFTIVLLTYEREEVLVEALWRLNNLPYLNKIIVVWNGETPPNPNIAWPKLSSTITAVKPERNSLNNRFLPYPEIETEAVLSMDDDVHLRHDEIVFGFRVWREARNKVVGFPARFHAWDAGSKRWLYNSNHSCELSMVLTGAAFIHKYYMYAYTYLMPAPIRNHVDKLMNCEDIAMNFLVSHMTREPPLKVTSRWTFRCPKCPETLSANESHFLERHDCINMFSRIYGYNPLLNTQFRVDSILFRTRIPATHQKCFKYI